jgi:hypothetical protein
MATVLDLAQAVKAQYPGVYDKHDDLTLGTAIRNQYPDAYGHFTDPHQPAQIDPEKLVQRNDTPLLSRALDHVKNVASGFLPATGTPLGRLLGKTIPGYATAAPEHSVATEYKNYLDAHDKMFPEATTAIAGLGQGDGAGLALGAAAPILAEGGSPKANFLSKSLEKQADMAALRSSGAAAHDIAGLRARLGSPAEAGRVLREMEVPGGETRRPTTGPEDPPRSRVVTPAASPETRFQRAGQVADFYGPKKADFVNSAGGLDMNSLLDRLQGLVKGVGSPEEYVSSGTKNTAEARALLRRFRRTYDQKTVGISKELEAAGAPDAFATSVEKGAAADSAADAATSADRTAASTLKHAQATDAADPLAAVEHGADPEVARTRQAAGTAAQAAEDAEAAAEPTRGMNRENVRMAESDTAPNRAQAQGEMDRAARTATAADRSAARAIKGADPLEAMDAGASDVPVIGPDGKPSNVAFESESNIGRTRRGATEAAQHAEAVEAENGPKTDHTSYGVDDTRLEPGTTRPRAESGWHVNRTEPMSAAQGDALLEKLYQDVYDTASHLNPDRPQEAIRNNPELRLKQSFAAALKEEIEASVGQAHGAEGLDAFRSTKDAYGNAKAFQTVLEKAANRAAASDSPFLLKQVLSKYISPAMSRGFERASQYSQLSPPTPGGVLLSSSLARRKEN